MEDKKIGENDKAIFYENIFSEDYGDGYRIIVAESKIDGKKEYLLLFKGKPVYAHTNIEAIDTRHDMLVYLDNKK